MFLGGLSPKSMCADDDYKLLDHGIGFTNVVMRASRGNANLTRKEIEDGKLYKGAIHKPVGHSSLKGSSVKKQ